MEDDGNENTDKLLGALKYLNLKAVWPHEERDFSPWLILPENLSKLAIALGIDDLQFEQREVPVGRFSADILASESTGRLVVIENQFGKTDHDHLGKLITYGATLGAVIVIWIAEEFRDEHRKAIEWLNEKTSDDLSLFAVQPEVIQIDDSKPAIRFNVVCRPNEAVRAASIVKARSEVSESQQLQLEFWTEFQKLLLDRKILSSTQTASPKYWFNVPLGRANIHLSNIFDTAKGKIGVRVYIGNRIAELALPQLEKLKSEIESELGMSLQWNPNPNNRDKIIAVFKDVDPMNRDEWAKHLDWLAETTRNFRKVFIPKVRALNLISKSEDTASL